MEIRMAKYDDVKGAQGSLKVRMVAVQKGYSLSTTAYSLNPEEICHASSPPAGALFHKA
jgi:hypothetical protein